MDIDKLLAELEESGDAISRQTQTIRWSDAILRFQYLVQETMDAEDPRWVDALPLLQQMLQYCEQYPDCWQARHNLAVMLLLRKQVAEAAQLLVDVLKRKVAPALLYTLAGCYMKLGLSRAACVTLAQLQA